jgi:hypothetical protein
MGAVNVPAAGLQGASGSLARGLVEPGEDAAGGCFSRCAALLAQRFELDLQVP